MTIKSTAASVESSLKSALFGYKDSAATLKAEHKAAREAILDDPMTSELAKTQNLEALNQQTRAKLDDLRGQQDSYVKNLRDKVERELRGNQPSDANSVLLRRDAADRARRIVEQQEAVDVLNDAIRNGDVEMAHAIGNRARNTGMSGVTEAYRAAFPDSAESAAALASVESMTSGPAYNVSNSITYSAPN